MNLMSAKLTVCDTQHYYIYITANLHNNNMMIWKHNGNKKSQNNLGTAASPPLMAGNRLTRWVC